jgi:cupin 2 domain-containing protein
MKRDVNNIFANIPQELPQELFEEIISTNVLKIERIVSDGHTTNDREWYDQDTNEWVIVLQGKAIVSFLGEEDILLQVGDYINIPAHKKHRVQWTKHNIKTIWLAVHY